MGRARDIRLMTDRQKIKQLEEKYHYFNIVEEKGIPPTEYILKFDLKGYINQAGQTASEHLVRLSLPEKYPFSAPPKFSFLNNLFHPNVYTNGDVCHGWYLNHWDMGIHIDDLIMDIARMICFKTNSYNLKSPANYFCNQEWILAHQIPIDHTNLIEKNTAHTYSIPDYLLPNDVYEQKMASQQQAENSPVKVKVKSQHTAGRVQNSWSEMPEQKKNVRQNWKHFIKILKK